MLLNGVSWFELYVRKSLSQFSQSWFLFQISHSAHYGDTWQAKLPSNFGTEWIETCTDDDVTCKDDSKAVADCSIIKSATGIFKVGIIIYILLLIVHIGIIVRFIYCLCLIIDNYLIMILY